MQSVTSVLTANLDLHKNRVVAKMSPVYVFSTFTNIQTFHKLPGTSCVQHAQLQKSEVSGHCIVQFCRLPKDPFVSIKK